MIELKSYTQVSLDTIQTSTKRRLAQNIAALEAWKKVKHLTKKDGTEFKYISKSFENASIDYDFLGCPLLKICFRDDYNGYSSDDINLYSTYNAYSKTQEYPENTYIDRVHYLTPLEAMEVVNKKIKYYENVIEEKKETLEKLETLYIEYTNKLKALYNDALDKCGDNRQLKSCIKEALEGVRVY